jgi:hypothetical protein
MALATIAACLSSNGATEFTGEQAVSIDVSMQALNILMVLIIIHFR